MTNQAVKKLALDLLHAETEEQVVRLLTQAGLWNDPRVWRLYGDTESNFSTIGNQQSRPEAALAEKVVNSVDALLMGECLKRGIDPTSPTAPQSITDAVATFFEAGITTPGLGGRISGWTDDSQREQARHITIAVTGAKAKSGNASITIADLGEGQSSKRVPETFLSLNRQNKLRIPFVQGKFNMGGTGALKFCGTQNLQLLITRRDPDVAATQREDGENVGRWSFTIARRERPSAGAGNVRNSVYRFLAPVGAETRPNCGEILSFTADALKMMPERNQPYEREMRSGSVIKLYEYDMKGFRSHALMKGGLLSRLDLLLPGIALPVRIHECRVYGGDEGRSFENTLTGLLARLEKGRGGNLEDGYPTSIHLRVRGEEMVAQIFAFKEGKAESYAATEGIIFAINGQTHASVPRTFFERRKVRMQRIASSLLVVIDCSALTVGAREDLFMNSRDRLSNGTLRKAIEEELEDAIGKHAGLLELQNRRRSEEIAERLAESKPLEDVLGSILKSSPSLSQLFLRGQRLTKPHRQTGENDGKNGGGSNNGKGDWKGRLHPTFFRFQEKPEGVTLRRRAELGRRCRIKFETDAENAYFSRSELRGRYHVEVVDGSLEGEELDHNITLHGGLANWSINLPEDRLSSGDEVTLECTVTDDTLVDPFVNIAQVALTPKSPDTGGRTGRRTERTGKGSERGDGGGSGTSDPEGAKAPGGLTMPHIIKVHTNDDNWRRYGFDERDGCFVVEEAMPDAEEQQALTFYVNVDNIFLRHDMKGDSDDAVRLIEAKFAYGTVLVGLALIHDSRSKVATADSENGERSIANSVRSVTRALAPFLVPMIDNLGALKDDQITGLALQGDDD